MAPVKLSKAPINQFPCPTCGELREIRQSIKKKPYFFCDSCGVQVFVRGKSGIERLSEIQKNSEFKKGLETLSRFESSRLLQLKTQISLVSAEINRVSETKIETWFLHENTDRLKALKSKLEGLEGEFFTLLSGN